VSVPTGRCKVSYIFWSTRPAQVVAILANSCMIRASSSSLGETLAHDLRARVAERQMALDSGLPPVPGACPFLDTDHLGLFQMPLQSGLSDSEDQLRT
jgi:hypothetical protein